MSPVISPASTDTEYSSHVNPQWVRLLNLLRMNVAYSRCQGAELITVDGRRILDFLSGYCVHNTGHNHPRIVAELKEELDRSGPAMVQSNVSHPAGELAGELCRLAGGRMRKVFFCSSGSEGVEAAIKFARAHTRRSGLLYARDGFHGLTCGALSLMSNPFWRSDFGPMLNGTQAVEFGDLRELESHVASGRYAAFIVEPVQGEGGVRVPPAEYLRAAQAICRRHGTLVVADEVQSGMFRTGRFLVSEHFGFEPDMVVLAKALSGGLVPSGALLMSDEVYESVFDSLKRSIVHTSTYSENSLAMRAGLATLRVLQQERLGNQALVQGEALRVRLREAIGGYEMVEEIRGIGLFCGIKFKVPERATLRYSFEAFQRINPALFGQALVSKLFHEENILTQICGNNFMVLKVTPPLTVQPAQVEFFIKGVQRAIEQLHSSRRFWVENLELASRAVRI